MTGVKRHMAATESSRPNVKRLRHVRSRFFASEPAYARQIGVFSLRSRNKSFQLELPSWKMPQNLPGEFL